MTAVFLKREPEARVRGTFVRGFDAIPDLVAFTSDAFARLGIDPGLLPTVDLAVEELFTNMVKYGGASEAPVRIEIAAIDGGVELTLIDRDVEPFDITQSGEVDIRAPIEKRKPGGLGLHLIRRMVDSVEYEYAKESRQSRITLRITGTGPVAR